MCMRVANYHPPSRSVRRCPAAARPGGIATRGSMTDFGIRLRSTDDFSRLRERVDAARAQARHAAEEYVRVRRTVDATRQVAWELRAEAAALRDSLRDSVMAYVAVLRGTRVPPERAIVLVKSAVIESDSCRDRHHRGVVEEAVRWAVDAYYAA